MDARPHAVHIESDEKAERLGGGDADYHFDDGLAQHRTHTRCRVCDLPFVPILAWHTLCSKCFRGSQLYFAIAHYRRVVS